MLKMLVRLLWKELRECWLVIVIAAVVPWVVLKIGHVTPLALPFIIIGSLCSPAAIMLWATTKGARRKDEAKLPLAHIPLNRQAEWLVTIAVPLIFSMLAGAWQGWLSAKYAEYGSTHTNIATVSYCGALYMAIAFAGCYLLSAAISGWAGVSAGLVWLIVGTALTDEVNKGRTGYLTWDSFFVRVGIAAVFCLALFLILANARRVRLARVGSVLLLVAAIFGPPIYRYIVGRGDGPPRPDYFAALYSQDRSLFVHEIHSHRGVTTAIFENRAAGWSSTQTLKGDVRPVAFDSAGRGYVLQQHPKSRWVHILVWTKTGVRQIARVHAIEEAIVYPVSNRAETPPDTADGAFVSPDTQHLVIPLRTWATRGKDVWIIDLRVGNGWIALSNILEPPKHASWVGDRVLLSGQMGAWTVYLREKTAADLPIVSGKGVER